jgi:Flp pilus assembly protein TadG
MRYGYSFRRRGAVAVQTAVMSALLIGCAALAVDVGMMYSARTELQRAADAAALAGVSGLFTDGKLIRDDASITAAVHGRAMQAALGNRVLIDR